MKKAMKKLTLVTLSTISLSAALPSSPIFAQEDMTTTMEAANLEDQQEDQEVEEASDLQKALEAALEQFKKDYPDVNISRLVVQPQEESEEADDLGQSMEEETAVEGEEAVETTTYEENEVDSIETISGDQDPYKISIEGLDGQDQAVEVVYDSITGEEIQDQDIADMMGEADEAVEVTDEAADLSQEAEEMVEGAEEAVSSEAEDLLGEDSSAEDLSQEPAYLDFDAYKTFDEIKEEAEKEAGFGQALEFTYSINEETNKAEVEVVVYEDPENPLEGQQAQITFDPETLEILKVEGTMEEGSDSQEMTPPATSQPTTEGEETTTESKEGEEKDKESSEESSQESEESSEETSEESTESTATEESKETTKADNEAPAEGQE
ncbi:hypothetical protein ACWODI_01775 [Facklamia languida]